MAREKLCWRENFDTSMSSSSTRGVKKIEQSQLPHHFLDGMKCLHAASSFGAHARERNGGPAPHHLCQLLGVPVETEVPRGRDCWKAITVTTIGIHAIMVEARPLPSLRCSAA
jgi:hypothetical protein